MFLKRYVCQHCVALKTGNHTPLLCVFDTNYQWELHIWPLVGKVGEPASDPAAQLNYMITKIQIEDWDSNSNVKVFRP